MKLRMMTICLLGLALAAQAQKPYVIKGTAPKGATKVYLSRLGVEKAPDSVVVKAGQFQFKGTYKDAEFINLTVPRKARLTMILDGNAQVNMAMQTVKGSALNAKFSQWRKKFVDAQEPLVAVSKEAQSFYLQKKEMPDSVQARLEATYEAGIARLLKMIGECEAANSDNIIPAYFIAAGQQFNMSKEDVIKYAESGKAYTKCALLEPLKEMAAGYKRSVKGATVTDFEMPDTAGVKHHLTDYVGKGNYVMVDFWASWCGPCRAEMPNVKAAYEKFHPKGFEIVGVSFDNKEAAWKGALKQLGMTWPQMSDLKGWQSEAGQIYGIRSIPATLLFGPDGKVVASDLRGEDLEKMLGEIYK